MACGTPNPWPRTITERDFLALSGQPSISLTSTILAFDKINHASRIWASCAGAPERRWKASVCPLQCFGNILDWSRLFRQVSPVSIQQHYAAGWRFYWSALDVFLVAVARATSLQKPLKQNTITWIVFVWYLSLFSRLFSLAIFSIRGFSSRMPV